MKQIKELFARLQEENPNLGDYIILTKLVQGKGYSENFINNLFKLVDKNDYEKGDKPLLVKHLVKLSK